MEQKKPQPHKRPQQPPKKKSFNTYKRSSIRHFSSILSMFVLIPVFAVIAVFLLVFPRSTESQIEKRKLAEFPAFSLQDYFSGAFTSGVTKFYDDTVPYRDEFKTAGYGFKNIFGFETSGSVTATGTLKTVKKPGSKKTESSQTSKTDSQTSDAQTSKETSEVSEEETSKQKDYTKEDAEYTVENGIIVVNQDGHYRALEMFGGGTGDTYVSALNEFRSKVNKDVKVYSMIAPLASEYYTPANYSDYTANQKEYFDDLASRLDSGIQSIDIDSVLAKHTEENIYFRTDHHWTSLGAYYAAQTFAKTAGVDFKDISTYQKKTINDFVGTMYAFTQDINIKNDPEDFDYYVPQNYNQCKAYYYDTAFNFNYSGEFFNDVGDPQSNAYLTFMGGDEQIVKVTTNVKNNRKLLIIKDSYGNAEPQFYLNSFSEIYVVDMRYFSPNLIDFTEQMGITDVLFTMVTYSAFGGNADNLSPIMNQNAGQTIVDTAKKED